MTTHGKRHAKQDIMDAAWKLFTEQGYDETTIAQIIELSGNSRSTFYHHGIPAGPPDADVPCG